MKGRTPSVTLNGNPMMSVPGQMYEGTCADCGAKLYLFIDTNNISTALVDWPVHTDEFHTLGDVKASRHLDHTQSPPAATARSVASPHEEQEQ